MPRFVYRRPDEEIVQTAAATLADDDDGPPLWVRPPLPLFRAPPQIEDDTPLLTLTLEEDPPPPWRPVLAWSMRVPLAQDAEDVGTLGLALDDGDSARLVACSTWNTRTPVFTDDDLPVTVVTTLAFEDDGGALQKLIPWVPPRAQPIPEDDLPVVVPIEEDAFPVRGSPVVALLRPPPQDAEDAPTLHGVYEEDRWLPGVPPRSNWLWWPPQPEGDWTPIPPGTVPPRASLQLFPQNRQGLALQRIAAMQLGLLPSGRLGLALVRSGPSQLSLSPVGWLSLSLSRSG